MFAFRFQSDIKSGVSVGLFLRCLFSLICYVCLQVTTTIGYGSPNKANSYSVHGSALGAKEVDATRKNLGWPYEPFHVPEDVKQ